MKPVTRRVALQLGLFGLAASRSARVEAQAQKPAWTLGLVDAARKQIGVTTLYDPSYRRIAYPGGDVAADRGVCTDVVIRAYRTAFGLDLQKRVHEDMVADFSAYPREWGMKAPDANIDHRRVPNLASYFRRKGAALPVSETAGDYKAGDLVTQMLPGNLAHIVIVSSSVSQAVPGRPMVIQNIGQGAREDDTLFDFPRTGHYRFAPV
jgi:uncharacterized protein YijF (DUF1287 family)